MPQRERGENYFESDLDPSKEAPEAGFEPGDAWSDPDPWLTSEQEAYQQAQTEDPLDVAYGAAEWRQAIANYFATQRQAGAEPEME